MCKENVGFHAQFQENKEFTLWIRAGWKSCLGSRVEITILCQGMWRQLSPSPS